MIRTSINVSGEVRRRLQEAAKKKGVGIESIILALMRYVSKQLKGELVAGKSVRYQERSSSDWECVRVKWFGKEYEFLIDMRKVHKKSVSRLIAEAAMAYIDEDGSIQDCIWDNYQHHSYSISKFNVQNYIGCIFFWGLTREPTTD